MNNVVRGGFVALWLALTLLAVYRGITQAPFTADAWFGVAMAWLATARLTILERSK